MKRLPQELCHKCGEPLMLTNGKRIYLKDLDKGEGKIPWICQKCAAMSCKFCGEPYVIPYRAHILLDDGTITFCKTYSSKNKCKNPECVNDFINGKSKKD